MSYFRSRSDKPDTASDITSDTASSLRYDGSERKATVPNVIVFGETGAGKSSVVNMLGVQKVERAETSSDAKGVTFQNTCYQKTILGEVFNIFDTVGLNEANKGTVPAGEAIRQLYELISKLDDGLSLLVYVMRASRITEVVRDNYQLFHETFCEKQVPVVIALTGLENEDDMDAWWPRNKAKFAEHDMSFRGSACITATRGKFKGGKYVFDEEYERSKVKVERLILESVERVPWKMPRKSWFATVAVRLQNAFAKLFNLKPRVVAISLYEALVNYGGLSREDALSMVTK